jgi:hypothetical protein
MAGPSEKRQNAKKANGRQQKAEIGLFVLPAVRDSLLVTDVLRGHLADLGWIWKFF